MATVTGITAELAAEIEQSSVVSGEVDENGILQLQKRSGEIFAAGSVVGPAGDPGLVGVVWAASYPGLIGDGTTNVTAVIQSILTASAGKLVIFPSGVFLTDPVYIPSKTSVMGCGVGTVFKRRPATVTNPDSIGVINVHGDIGLRHEDVFVSNFVIDANKANIVVDSGAGGDPLDVEGLSLKYSDRTHVQYLIIKNVTSEGIDVDDSSDGLISDCVIMDTGGSAIHFSNGAQRMVANNCFAWRSGFDKSRGAFDAYGGSSECQFNSCHSHDSYYGFTGAGPGTQFVNCRDYGSSQNNLRVTGESITVDNFYGVGCTAGNGLTVAATAVNATLRGVVINDANQTGIRVLVGATNARVTACTVKNPGGSGIWHQGTNGSVKDCVAPTITIADNGVDRGGNTPDGWTTATLETGWSVPAGMDAPKWRITDGWCEYTGSLSYSSAVATGVATAMLALGLPAPVGVTVNNGVMNPVSVGSSAIAAANARPDGTIKIYFQTAYTAGQVVHLHGYRYRVA